MSSSTLTNGVSFRRSTRHQAEYTVLVWDEPAGIAARMTDGRWFAFTSERILVNHYGTRTEAANALAARAGYGRVSA